MIEQLLLSLFFYRLPLPASVQAEEQAGDRGQLTVALEHAPVRSVQPGAQRVPMLALRATASCEGDREIRSIRVRRRGLGASDDILSVYLLSDGQRLTRGRQLSREGFADLQMRNFSVPACETKLLQVSADFSPDALRAGEHWMTVERAQDIDAAGASVSLVAADSPPARSRAVGPTRGTIAVTYLPVRTPVRYGRGRTVQRIRLEADGEGDHLLRAITFTNRGSASDADVQGLFLQSGKAGRISDHTDRLSGSRARIVFDPPLLLTKNQSKVLELKVDVLAGRSRTIDFIIEEPGDLEAEESRTRST